ncbi:MULTISPECIES: glycoside hydrolase family 32 protein [unclassified Nostoc]|uniref:glycoside hydrolase family 32 protein n=1 Tax=unclassified Nostoc TaxID=2593658 RepID=UPI002629EFCC|nr:glycoside hydrolase family 32 protein [Nostoc sp. S13]MDF5735586.1 glycoside hydrolase family 32 protein [Nostoc sp. S13]
MKVRTVSVLYATAALLIFPVPARSAIEKVVGGGSVHQGETRRITVVGDGIDFATSVASSDARISVRLLSKKGLAQGRAKGQILLEVAVPLDVPKDQNFNLTVKIAPNLYYSKGGSETVRLNVQEYPNSSWRPFFHFAPSWGWMNDPNGLVYVNGTYHLYYQAIPFSRDLNGQLNWGHAVSTDLVHWSQRRDAMFSPSMDLLPSSDDQNQVWSPFSGSAVTVSGEAARQLPCDCSNLCVASIFTKNTAIISLQDQWLAASCNGGESFKAPESVLPNLTPPKPDFRDPKVFPYKGRWIMVLAVGDKAELYGSANLRQWHLLSSIPLYSSFTTLGPFVETPDLFELPISNSGTNQTKWILTYSEGFLPPVVCQGLRDSTEMPLTDPKLKKDCERSRKFTSRSFYIVGEFDGKQFKQESQPRPIDFGSDFYAPQTWSGTPGRRILAGWQNNWHYAHQTPTTPWRGQLSIPRDLGLMRDSDTYWLTQTPVQELALLRNSALGRVTRLRDKPLTNRTPEELKNFRSTAFDADLAIDVAGLPKVNSEIKIHLRAGNTGQGMVLAWRRTGSDKGELSLTRSASEAGGSTSELKQQESGFIGKWLSVSLPFAASTIQRLVSNFRNAQPNESSQITQVPVVTRGTNNSLLKLRILVDRSSVEVFAGDGRVVLSSLFFPNSANKEFKLYATGGNAKIVSLVIYPFSND